MQYTQATLAVTKQHAQLDIELDDLLQAFATIADPRRAQGRRYWLPSLLCLAVAAILCNCRSVLAIAEWAALQSDQLRAALGLPLEYSPNQSTLHRLFRRLDPQQLNSALSNYFDPATAATRRRGEQAVAVDGKSHRAQLQFQRPGSCTIHDIAAFCHEVGVVLAQLALDNHNGEAELTGAPKLIGQLNWQGRILTGDALYTQLGLCEQVLADGGDYLLVVKDNQGGLLEELEVLFRAPEMANAQTARQLGFDYRAASTIEKGHGRIEQRRAIASSELRGYSRWPGLQQVVQIRRIWEEKGKTKQATHYLVTSLPAEEAGVGRLMALRRGHWRIENSLHYVKDVTLGEDSSLVHVGNGAAVMSALRSTVISLLHRAGKRAIASALRTNSQRPQQALQLMGLLNSSDA